MSQYRNYIAGEWSSSDRQTVNVNPSDTNDIIGEYARASRDDAERAIAAAHAAFPRWSRQSPQVRSAALKHVGDQILARKEEIGDLLAREEGKTLREAVGETVRAAQIFHFFAGEAVRLVGDHQPSIRADIDVEVRREPLGVVGLITPWNFPIAIPAWKIAPALAFGNCVVFKPAELVPGCAHMLAEIIAQTGIDPGVFNLVMGSGAEVGAAFAESPLVRGLSFTGSVGVGRVIAANCVTGEPMKRFQLEMGGKNALIVTDDAMLDTAVDCAIDGAFYSTGQRCTASSRIIVTRKIHAAFVDAMKARMERLAVDDARKEGTDIGPVVDERQLGQNRSYIDIGVNEGATLLGGGELLERGAPGHYMAPALFVGVDPKMRIAREEIFGPVASVIEVADYDEALSVANDSEFGLSAGICTTSLSTARHFLRNIEAGMAMVNLATAGVDYHVPFGGTKASSFGAREQGRYAAEFYTTVKTAYVAG
ncbi:aldehyde dehydrogenase family protein [Sphingopyxis sp. XHP0097]|uniref:Aldehyde dehydrogenase family protein n=1 Tax=Sphingopyxis jiangsuensis TaxID=2871171 RepID=A0ABS7MI15_9SPHN|nr:MULTISPECIES: aldehyde dehydrogenase family protein [Sphingopyxis]MBY4638406.1 aldehyde dehydrogenase family protein [Sphingopyxis jiangsuensis]